MGLLIAYDDMDSLSKEEQMGVLAFDGGNIGTKQDGLQKLVSKIQLSARAKWRHCIVLFTTTTDSVKTLGLIMCIFILKHQIPRLTKKYFFQKILFT